MSIVYEYKLEYINIYKYEYFSTQSKFRHIFLWDYILIRKNKQKKKLG